MKGQGNSFDDKWKDAFEGAELEPNKAVWAGLDKHLSDKEISTLKNRLFYWRLAAAVLLLFFTMGSGIWWTGRNATDKSIAMQQPANNSQSQKHNASPNSHNQHSTGVPATVSESSQVAIITPPASPSSGALSQQQSDIMPTNKPANGQVYNRDFNDASQVVASPLAQVIAKEQESQINLPAGENTEAEGRKPKNLPATKLRSSPTTIADQVPTDKNQSGKQKTQKKPLNSTDKSTSLLKLATAKESESGQVVQTLRPDSELQIAVEKSLHSNQRLHVANSYEQAHQRGEVEQLTTLSPLSMKIDKSDALEKGLADKKIASFQKESIWLTQPIEEEEKTKQSSIWTSLAFSPTYFNSNLETNYQPTYTNLYNSNYAAFTVPDQSTTPTSKDVSKPNFSYTVAVQVGKDLSKKWMVVTGVHYLYNDSQLQTSTYTENTVTNQKQSLLVAMLNNSAPDQATSEITMSDSRGKSILLNNPQASPNIDIRNQYEYIGIPIKLGYRINPDKRLVVSASAGVSTNLFLRNKLSGSDDDISSTVIKAGTNSAYRLLNLSALVSMGIHYSYSDQLALTLEPTYNTALYSTTKTSSSVRSLPTSLGIGAGIKYHFK